MKYSVGSHSRLCARVVLLGNRFASQRRGACYSGVFLRPLANDDTLVITAADSHHSSFGCQDKVKWTYFGDVGLLHPIVVRGDGTLIAGERRLAACRLLGWTDVLTTVVHLAEIVRGEFAENAHRKDFQPTEIEAIYRATANAAARP